LDDRALKFPKGRLAGVFKYAVYGLASPVYDLVIGVD
jgi:hypothetical protein